MIRLPVRGLAAIVALGLGAGALAFAGRDVVASARAQAGPQPAPPSVARSADARTERATATRGAPRSGPANAVDRVGVPAGPFTQGSAHGGDDERPVRTRSLGAFSIDRTEVTRAAYARCVAAKRCRPVPEAHAARPGADGNLPVTGVSWTDARAFCRFTGGRLPAEAEWEKAARGTDGREYPWGDDAACERANWGNFDGEGPCAGKNPGSPVAVGRYQAGASPFGALDMAGNVWEWVEDRYDEDPRRRVVRGGSCCSYFVPPRSANRNAWAPDYRDSDLGFRCAGGATRRP